jgi:ABC-type multidrug transport system permease subunit
LPSPKGAPAHDSQAAQGIGFLVLPLTFASSAYVPVSSMPGWLRVFAERQPVTIVINAVRALTSGRSAEATLGHPTGYFTLRALLWIVAIILIFGTLAITRIRRS